MRKREGERLLERETKIVRERERHTEIFVFYKMRIKVKESKMEKEGDKGKQI